MSISKEFKVGLFMVISITILYLGFNYLKGIEFFSTTDKYYAVYGNVNGLNVSNPVLINGYIVGRVSDISIMQGNENQILVELDINGDIVLGDSAEATLNSDFLGNKSISLKTGNISVPINSGDTLLAVLDKGITDILAESAQPVANNLEATIKKINTILDQLGGTRGKIDSILNEMHMTPRLLNATLISTKHNLDSITRTYNQVGIDLSTTLKGAKPMLNNLTQFTDSLKRMELNKTIKETNATLEKLNKAVVHFTDENGTLGKLVKDDSLYIHMKSAVQSLDELLKHMDKNPKHFFAPLGKSSKKIEKDRKKEAKNQ